MFELNKLQLKFALNSNCVTAKENCYVVSLDEFHVINVTKNFLCILTIKFQQFRTGIGL